MVFRYDRLRDNMRSAYGSVRRQASNKQNIMMMAIVLFTMIAIAFTFVGIIYINHPTIKKQAGLAGGIAAGWMIPIILSLINIHLIKKNC